MEEKEMVNGVENTEIKGGTFYQNLIKNAKAIKETRALSLAEDVDFAYKNKVEVLRRSIREKYRKIEDSLDLYPNNVTSLQLASDFDAQQFVENDLKTNVDIRNLEIELQIAVSRYKLLTGKHI
jgi:hypothetical protein